MQNETQASCGVVLHGLESELTSFQTLLDKPITEELLDRWITDTRVRDRSGVANILSNTIWGTIRWPKSFGRPLGSTLASAFVIKHVHWDSRMEITPSGVARIIDILAPHPEPSKWDGPDDEDYYRVSFMADTPQRPTRIRVSFAEDIRWEKILGTYIIRGYRDIAPSERQFIKGDKMSVLEPFEVVIKPFSLFLQT